MMRIKTAVKKLMQYYEIAKNNDWIRDKVAWALYQTWKEAYESTMRGEKE